MPIFIKWSPDGSQVILNLGGKIYSAQANGSQTKLLVDTGWPAQKERSQGEKRERRGPFTPAPYADISPNGYMIAYSACRSNEGGPNNSEIEVMDLRSGAVTRVTTTEDYEGFPQWSPDGEEIAFVYASGHRTGIKAIPFPPNTPARNMTDKYLNVDLGPIRWSPKEDRIAFVSRNGHLHHRETYGRQ